MRASSDHVYLVRHGEVANPEGVVYADLPGYSLSPEGRRQTIATADHLPTGAVVVSSPLDRAVETAEIAASRLGGRTTVDERLTEWRVGSNWAGHRWSDLSSLFPGELEAYLDHPEDLAFSAETLADLADRVGSSVTAHRAARSGPLVVISHQDPIQAARLALTGRPLSQLHRDKPLHAEVIELRVGASGRWIECGSWAPDQAPVSPSIDMARATH